MGFVTSMLEKLDNTLKSVKLIIRTTRGTPNEVQKLNISPGGEYPLDNWPSEGKIEVINLKWKT